MMRKKKKRRALQLFPQIFDSNPKTKTLRFPT